MDKRRALRASDADREAAVTRLGAALNEGRLTLHEYDDRLARAWQATTYGEIADLFADLPAPSGRGAKRDRVTMAGGPPPPGLFGGLPVALRVLWTIWLTAVSINLVIWLLVSLSNSDPHYFWPMWVAGPAGAGLLGVSIGVLALSRGREHNR